MQPLQLVPDLHLGAAEEELTVNPLTGRVISCLGPVHARRRLWSSLPPKEQRLRRGLLCAPLTSRNELPHTMIGGVSGATTWSRLPDMCDSLTLRMLGPGGLPGLL